jgi:hypothetical protein
MQRKSEQVPITLAGTRFNYTAHTNTELHSNPPAGGFLLPETLLDLYVELMRSLTGLTINKLDCGLLLNHQYFRLLFAFFMVILY